MSDATLSDTLPEKQRSKTSRNSRTLAASDALFSSSAASVNDDDTRAKFGPTNAAIFEL